MFYKYIGNIKELCDYYRLACKMQGDSNHREFARPVNGSENFCKCAVSDSRTERYVAFITQFHLSCTS